METEKREPPEYLGAVLIMGRLSKTVVIDHIVANYTVKKPKKAKPSSNSAIRRSRLLAVISTLGTTPVG